MNKKILRGQLFGKCGWEHGRINISKAQLEVKRGTQAEVNKPPRAPYTPVQTQRFFKWESRPLVQYKYSGIQPAGPAAKHRTYEGRHDIARPVTIPPVIAIGNSVVQERRFMLGEHYALVSYTCDLCYTLGWDIGVIDFECECECYMMGCVGFMLYHLKGAFRALVDWYTCRTAYENIGRIYGHID